MNNKKPGYITVGKFRQIPVFVHWSFPIGGLLIALFLQARNIEIISACIAYMLLVILHEIGHVIAAHMFRAKVFSIELSGLGGICWAEMPLTRRLAFLYASAGLIVQVILLSISVLCVIFIGWPKNKVFSSIAFVLIHVNALLIIINLIPKKAYSSNIGSDGYILWTLVVQVFSQRPYSFPDTSATFSPKTSLLFVDGFVPDGFSVGIEIFNDNTTPMVFVVDILSNHLGISREIATELMLTIHQNGGLLIPLETYERAVDVATAITSEAANRGYKFICRPVDAQRGPLANKV